MADLTRQRVKRTRTTSGTIVSRESMESTRRRAQSYVLRLPETERLSRTEIVRTVSKYKRGEMRIVNVYEDGRSRSASNE